MRNRRVRLYDPEAQGDPKRCARCSKPLTRRQTGQGNACCSRACGRRWKHGQNQLDAVLAILRLQDGWSMTASDLAFWRFGSDDPADVRAIRTAIYRLRRSGVGIETRSLPSASRPNAPVFGYRLRAPVLECVA